MNGMKGRRPPKNRDKKKRPRLPRPEHVSPTDPEVTGAEAAYMNSLVVRSLEDDAIVNPPRLLTGHDIMSLLGIEEGPQVGRLLATLREAQAAGEVTDAEAARRLVRQAARRESESAQISG